MARHTMGKRKSGKRKSVSGPKRSHRRKRVGASGGIEPIIMNGLAVGGGVVAARELSILAGGLFPSLKGNPVITGALEAATGGVVCYMSKAGWMRFAGLGAIGEGVMTILNGFGVIGGPPQTMSYNFTNRRQMGDPRLQFVAGPRTRIGMGDYPNNFPTVAGPRKRRYTS